ncbi:hypothetical protein AB1Y20_010954 [Prymnesium parvum]|uniref:Glucosidase II subunit alpha n=1 Tax=Prymnesium parvum TaxID=97485 RepID=A0AB34ISS0_PRYPA
MRSPPLLALLLALSPTPSAAVDHAKFRTCAKTGFCRRHRDAPPSRAFLIAPASLQLTPHGVLAAQLHGGPFGVPLNLTLEAYSCGVLRLRAVEASPLHGARWEAEDLLEPSLRPAALTPIDADEAAALLPPGASPLAALRAGSARAYGLSSGGGAVALVHLHPFSLELWQHGARSLHVNPAGKLYFEHHRAKDDASTPLPAAGAEDEAHGGKEIVDYGEDGLAVYADGSKQQKASEAEAPPPPAAADDSLWEESFGAHRDSKPYGPSSVGMDIRFDGFTHVYGLAEHAAPMNLPSTRGEGARYAEPYRLWTLDVYDYELDSPMALYGGVPLLLAHSAASTAAALWFNPTETFIDISREQVDGVDTTSSFWMSESGVIDLMLLPGPTPADIFRQYAALTGVTPLPPRFALGYHQCRWNYNDEADVRYVHGQFEALDIPYDVLWLDIEHTDGKRYFTWDKFKFPHPKELQEELALTGRKMVTIVDPHIKKDSGYKVYQEAHEKGLFIQTRDGAELDGWCWPGASAYLDFTSPEVREWWAGRFAYDEYEGSTPTLYTWNDMNEPSVFNGPEVSMDKDAKSLAGVEHREWHNLYGMYMQQATAEGLLKRNPEQDKRPFVLSRSFYAGSQRWGAIWTGDNACLWSHLEAASPMLLTLGLCGITFSGADVGGFLGKGGGYGDPDAELFTRWFQAGAYQPFFRGHAHHDSKRREPWTFDDLTTVRLREVAKQRYQLLAYWYTLFYEAEMTGMPTMRPLWVEFPADVKTFDMDKQFMSGPAFLVKPITSQGATSTSVYFPGAGTKWYDAVDGTPYTGGSEPTVSAPIDKLPVFQRGGTIVPRQMRLRRASSLMGADPFTLVVAPDASGAANGTLFLDAGDGYAYRRGEHAYMAYSYAAATLRASRRSGSGAYAPPNVLERVELLGVGVPSRVVLRHAAGEEALGFTLNAESGRLVVRKPAVKMAADDWQIELIYA